MSYEGYIQQVCPNGHYLEVDCYAADLDDEKSCPHCGEEWAWENSVDTTNGEHQGRIEPTQLTPALYRPKGTVTWYTLEDLEVQRATYEVPDD
jgi:hypothetical protein